MQLMAEQDGVTSAVLTSLFGCSERLIYQLARKGIVVRVGRNRYNAPQSTRNYIKHLREQAAARVAQMPDVESVAANVKYKAASTELLQLRLRKEAAELIEVADV